MSIGNIGELIIERWAEEVNINPNRSIKDRTGWDIILEFPEELNNENGPLDLSESPIQCLVQIKTTSRDDPEYSIKLSNIKRLVDTPLPAFFIIIKLNSNKNPVKVFIYHVGKELIYNALKKMRLLKKGEKINRKRVQLPKRIRKELETLDGKGLKKAIELEIGDNYKKYLNLKRRLKEESGYEDFKSKIHFSFKLPDEYKGTHEEYLMDLELGLIPSITIENFIQEDVRFGKPVEVVKNGKGILSISSKGDENTAFLVLRTTDNREITKVKATLSIPIATRPLGKKKNVKILLKMPYIQIILMPYKNNITYSFKFPSVQEDIRLKELNGLVDILWFINKVKNIDEGIILDVYLDENKLISGALYINEDKKTNDLETRIISVKNAINICKYFDISLDQTIKISQLLEERNKLLFLSKIISPSYLNLLVRFKVEGKIELDKYNEEMLVIPIEFNIGKCIIQVIIGIRGILDFIGKVDNEYEYKTSSSNISILKYQISDGDFTLPVSLESLLSEINDEFDKEDKLLIVQSSNFL